MRTVCDPRSTAAMMYDEGLAVARLRQWANDKDRQKNNRATEYQRTAWAERRQSQYDARQVRVIDFDRILNMLSNDYRLSLIFHYRDGHSAAEIATLIGCSERKVAYVLPLARKELATLLDRYNLL
jgi:DNA-directed RNA polymerase specialized sigma24 family protein